jgi:hypothetical protein
MFADVWESSKVPNNSWSYTVSDIQTIISLRNTYFSPLLKLQNTFNQKQSHQPHTTYTPFCRLWCLLMSGNRQKFLIILDLTQLVIFRPLILSEIRILALYLNFRTLKLKNKAINPIQAIHHFVGYDVCWCLAIVKSS